MKKRIIAIIVIVSTVAVLIAALFIVSLIFTPKKISNIATLDMWQGYYNEPEGSVDAIFVGPSTMYYGVAPGDIYDRAGFTSYVVAAPSQNYFFSKVYVEEALKYQEDIKVVVLENLIFQDICFDDKEPMYRTNMDNLRFGWTKVKAAWEIAANSKEQSFLSYVFPLLRYHDRWTNLKRSDFNIFSNEPYYLKGYSSGATYRNKSSYIPIFENPSDEVDDSYYQKSVEILAEIKDLCDEKGVELLVVRMPVLDSVKYSSARQNASVELFEEMGIDYFDFNTEDVWNEIGINVKQDFTSIHHLNILGSYKLSNFFADFLSEEYDLPNHKGDSAYDSWSDTVINTRIAKMEWLNRVADVASYTASKKSLAGANFTIGENLKLTWPMFPYVENLNVYKLINSDAEPILIKSTTDEDSMIVKKFDKTTKFILEYTIEGCDEPIRVNVNITPPIGYIKKDEGVVVQWRSFKGVISMKLIRSDSEEIKDNSVVLLETDDETSFTDNPSAKGYYIIEYTFEDHVSTYSVKIK